MFKKLLAAVVAACVFVAPVVPVTVLTVPLVAGCTTVAPGNEAWVVNTERELQTAFRLVDAFLGWEASNRGTGAFGADVTKAADTIRVQFPSVYRSTVSALRAYKAARTPEGKANVQAYLTLAQGLAKVAASYYANPINQ